MQKTILLLAVIIGFIACTTKNSKGENSKDEFTAEALKDSIKILDDSLKTLISEAVQSSNYNFSQKIYYEIIDKSKSFYSHFPTNPYSEIALDKITSIYLQLNKEEEAVKWRDTLLTKFPNNKNKTGLLELQMNYYDYNEYSPEKIKFYIDQLLLIEDLSPEERQRYEFRLKHIDKTFLELIELQEELSDTEK